MKRIPLVTIALLLLATACLITGQVTLSEIFRIQGTVDTAVESACIDLNNDPDYREHKDKILQVNELSIVAIIETSAKTGLGVSELAGALRTRVASKRDGLARHLPASSANCVRPPRTPLAVWASRVPTASWVSPPVTPSAKPWLPNVVPTA